ncbi:hypothetical protein PS896_01403 [Pseudomonas fluorescens]|jgi:hypothetical protein|uniref:Uncharacterized protein n=1 Tax=Pseudomonas fluorescens TaxID=294 RepID=A0A5E7I7Y0_PSEFL|nr:hypothetical protein PS896_01403 [Pseudomonas fluorescens]
MLGRELSEFVRRRERIGKKSYKLPISILTFNMDIA